MVNMYLTAAFAVLCVVGVVLVLQKDTDTKSKTGVRAIGVGLIAVSVIYGGYVLFKMSRGVSGGEFFGISAGEVSEVSGGDFTGGERCVSVPKALMSERCSVKGIDMTFFEKLISLFFPAWAQSMARARLRS
jgi:hypothetical protein